MYDPGSRIQMPNDLLNAQRVGGGHEVPEEVKADGGVSVQQSNIYNNSGSLASNYMRGAMAQNNGKDSVPATNKYEQMGRTGLVDPSLTNQQTPLPAIRRMDQAENYKAIINSLPMAMQQQNQSIVRAIETSYPAMQRQFKQSDSLYS